LYFLPEKQDFKRVILSVEEITKFLDGIRVDRLLGLRDRAIFELMYSSGLRRREVVNLDVGDVDLERRMVLIRKSKYGKDRIVPVNEVAARFLRKYLEGRTDGSKPLFLGPNGRLSLTGLDALFARHVKQAGIDRPGLSMHSIRHTTATHLLEQGANIRYVQELLGHENIQTTVRYTHALVESMKKIYRSFHPRENAYFKEMMDTYAVKLESFLEELKRVKGYSRREEVRLKKRVVRERLKTRSLAAATSGRKRWYAKA
jgi:integrase/recombinase XerD